MDLDEAESIKLLLEMKKKKGMKLSEKDKELKVIAERTFKEFEDVFKKLEDF